MSESSSRGGGSVLSNFRPSRALASLAAFSEFFLISFWSCFSSMLALGFRALFGGSRRPSLYTFAHGQAFRFLERQSEFPAAVVGLARSEARTDLSARTVAGERCAEH